MSSWKTTVRFLAVLAVLVIAIVLSHFLDRPPETSSYLVAGAIFPDLVVDELTTVTMEKEELKLTLTRKGDEWLVEEQFGYPAQTMMVDNLLNTLRRYNDASVFSDKPDIHEEFNVTEKTGVTVTMKTGEKVVGQFIAGKTSFTPTTGYIRRVGDDRVLEVYGNTATLFNPRPGVWVKTSMFDVTPESIASIKVSQLNREPFEISLKDNEWKFVPESVETPNSRFCGMLARYLGQLSFKEVLDSNKDMVARQLDPPSWEIAITTQGGDVHTLRIGAKKDAEVHFASFDDKPFVVALPNRIVEQLLVTRENVISGNITGTQQPQEKKPHPTKYTVQGKGEELPQVKIVTNKGEIVVELWEDDAPNTVANFVYLAEKGFYNGLTFHRHEPSIVLQGGDPNGNGSGGPGWRIEAEVNPRKYDFGVMGMADSGVDTAGSQFFFSYSRMAQWDGRYTTFGVIVEGREVFQQLTKGDSIVRMEVLRKRNHAYRPFVYKTGSDKEEQVQ